VYNPPRTLIFKAILAYPKKGVSMTHLILKTWNIDEVALRVREALPRNPKVMVSATTYPHFEKKVEFRELKLNGVASGATGLIFTFENGHRLTLQPLNEDLGDDGKISIVVKAEPKSRWEKKPPYRAQVKFTDNTGTSIAITLPYK